MKYRILFSCLLILLCLSGCKKETPPEGTTPIETEQGSVATLPAEGPSESVPVNTPTPMTEEELKQDFAQMWVSTLKNYLTLVYIAADYPIFYPVDEANLTLLRDTLTTWNERYPEIQWDPYSIELCTWGFQVTVTRPVDAMGNSQYVWFEVMPDDITQPRLIVASAGEDGELTFKGTGADYSDGGFGDDDVRFLTF